MRRLIAILVAGLAALPPFVHSSTPPVEKQSSQLRPGMHPSWDLDNDGINDCEKDGSCDHSVDYTKPRTINPSFDCSKAAQGTSEGIICSDAELALLDKQLADVYQAAWRQAKKPSRNTLRAMQRGWLKGRDECWKDPDRRACIKQAYQNRIQELQQMSADSTQK
ncbi:hypothetical protein GCM10009092_19280 [Bowmanella denitrificans]|uniref:Lysozyme inhibitor LprI-like N-terminal domain-containing protein n=1 Tax=Bowmanella denitrificans TaxID=366582 RepID=A0ABN0X4V5_9ALTE